MHFRIARLILPPLRLNRRLNWNLIDCDDVVVDVVVMFQLYLGSYLTENEQLVSVFFYSNPIQTSKPNFWT